MIKTLVLNRESREFSLCASPDAISEVCALSPNIVWVDVSDPTSEDFDKLAQEFGFHPLSIEDCRNEHQRPKIEEFQGYYFIVLYEAELILGKHLELRELNIFLGKNYLVTVHSQPIRAIAATEKAGYRSYRWLGPGTQRLRLVCAWSSRVEDVDGFVETARSALA